MLNNYTDQQISYQNCNIIQPAGNGNGCLLIGDFNSATDAQKMKQYNIKTVITAAANMQHLQIPNNIVHITYPLLDVNSQNIKRFFDQSTIMIKNCLKNGGVLVHCAAGISRSATLVIAYIMKTRKITFKQAIAYIRINRNVRPNLGFQRQLKQYQKQIIEGQQNRLHDKKIIVGQKITEQRRTSYNRSSNLGKMGNDFIKFQPKTAEQALRRKNQQIRRIPFPHSQSRPRQRKNINFKVRPIISNSNVSGNGNGYGNVNGYGYGKQAFYVLGQAHGGLKQQNLQESIGYSQQIKPPIIQHHHKNALNNGWMKFQIKKHY